MSMAHFYKLMLITACLAGMTAAQTPLFRWVKSGGGTNSDIGYGITVDRSGNSYAVGYFLSASIAFESDTLSNAGGHDLYLVKYDPDGNVVWAKSAGGVSDDYGISVAVDSSDNIYLTGYFLSPNIVFGADTLRNTGGASDIFLVKYDAGGNVLWAKSAGGDNSDHVESIAIDRTGNILLTGGFYSSSITFDSVTLTNLNPGSDIFIVKYDPAGNALWAKSTGGNDNDVGIGVAVDPAGNAYITGFFQSSSITFGSDVLLRTNGASMFVAKYSADGNVVWAKTAGGNSVNDAYGIAVDDSGNSFVTGFYYALSLVFGSDTLTSGGGYDIFIVKYNRNGNVVWARSYGGSAGDFGLAVAAEESGYSYVTGYFRSPTLVIGPDTLVNSGGSDLYVAKLDPAGDPQWAMSVGSGTVVEGFGIGVDGSGNSYVTGYYHAASVVFVPDTLISAGSDDMFIAKIGATRTRVESGHAQPPQDFILYQNYPNPFNPVTVISYQVASRTRVILQLFDQLGREVGTLMNTIQGPGYKTVNFDARFLPSGVYYYQLRTGKNIATKKLILLK